MEYQVVFYNENDVRVNGSIIQLEDFEKTLFMKQLGYSPYTDNDSKIAQEYLKNKRDYRIIPTVPTASKVSLFNTHGLLLNSFLLKEESVNSKTNFTKFYSLEKIEEKKQTYDPLTEPLDIKLKPGKNYIIEEM